MLAFLTRKPVIIGLAAVVLATSIGLGYHHYTGLLARVETLQAETSTLRLGLDTEREAVVQLQDVIKDWEETQADLLERVKEMQDEANEARAETRRLRQLFAELDFHAMAPAAIDSVADATTDRLWRLIHTATDPGGYGAGGAAAGEASPSVSGAGGPSAGGLDGDRDPERAGDRLD